MTTDMMPSATSGMVAILGPTNMHPSCMMHPLTFNELPARIPFLIFIHTSWQPRQLQITRRKQHPPGPLGGLA